MPLDTDNAVFNHSFEYTPQAVLNWREEPSWDVSLLCTEKTGCGDELGTDGRDTLTHYTMSKFCEPFPEINKNSDVL